MSSNGHRRRGTRVLFVIAVPLLLAIGVVVIGSSWNRLSVQKYEMSVAFDGKAPWGDVGPESENERAPTVLYRLGGKSYCYTAFQLASLRDRLQQANNTHVTVEYNVFATFGHEGKYTLLRGRCSF